MPRDRLAPVLSPGALTLWSGLCLGTLLACAGCSPWTPTEGGAQPTSPRLSAMQAKGRAAMTSKSTKRASQPAPPKSNPR
jgi:hypothetical protein